MNTTIPYEGMLRSMSVDKGRPCLWCESEDTGLIQPAACRYGDHPINIWHCFGCGSRFSSWDRNVTIDYDAIGQRHSWYRMRKPNAAYIAGILALGPDYFWAFTVAEHMNYIRTIPDMRYREFLSRVTKAHGDGRRLRIFEAGFGAGIMGGISAHLGHDYYGVDVDSGATETARKLFASFGAKYACVSPDWYERAVDEQYDFVFCSDVIEHVHNPRGLLSRLVSLIAAGGTLIVTTPDLNLGRFHVWPTDLPPIHTVFLNAAAVRLVMAQYHATRAIQIFNERWGLPPPPEVPAETITLIPGAQMDPARPDFYYDIANMDLGHPETRGADGPATSNVGSSLIAVIA